MSQSASLASQETFLRVVLEVGRAVGSGAGMAELLGMIVAAAAEVGAAPRVAIAFVHDQGDALTLRAWRGLDDARARGWIGQSGRGLLGRAVAQQCPFELSEIPADEREDLWEGPWALALPLVAEQRPKGVLLLDRREPFSASDRSGLEALCAHFAAAIDNAWLYDRYRTLNADLEAKVEARTRELQQAQAQLLQQEKLASLGQLTAGVAHEINNPLAYVSSNLSILEAKLAVLRRRAELAAASDPDGRRSLIAAWRDDPRWGQDAARAIDQGAADQQSFLAHVARVDAAEEGDPAEVMVAMTRFLARTREGVERIKGIVRDLRAFARMDGQRFDEVDLHEGLDQTLGLLEHHFRGTDVTLTKTYELDRKVPGQPGRLNQVFMNLLVNAAQAVQGRGAIRLRTFREGDWAVVEVHDTGVGIPPEVLPRLFDPFFTTKPVGDGTGLGLSLTYGIVTEHGGTLHVESTPAEGTTFRVRLPLTRREP